VEPPPPGQASTTLDIEFGLLRLQTLLVRGEDVELGFDDYPILGHPPLTGQQLAMLELRQRRAEMALAAKQAREEAEQQARQAALDALLEPLLVDRTGEDHEDDAADAHKVVVKSAGRAGSVGAAADGENASTDDSTDSNSPPKLKFSMSFGLLPVRPWLNILSFLPTYTDLTSWAHLSRGFYRGVHEHVQRRRASLSLRRVEATRLAEAFEHLGMFCSDHLRQVTLTECASLRDTHLDTLSVSITALTALSIDACPAVTDDGLLPVLASHVRSSLSCGFEHLHHFVFHDRSHHSLSLSLFQI
jgi:hypothetical protein